MSVKHVVISSYSDLAKLNKKVKSAHFRKFVSRKLFKAIVERCPNLERVSISPYAFRRCHLDLLVSFSKFSLQVSDGKVGRPSIIEKIVQGGDKEWNIKEVL
ncbi:MAG TPA: hypothetical protein VJH34_00330 [archaeon]|nr:hypothetical protein [archaeon]